MRLLAVIFLALALAGCATVKKIESGKNTVGDRLTVEIDGHWNHLDFPGIRPAQVWTMEGIAVDELLLYSGIRDGQAMHPDDSADKKKKNFVFRKTMPIEELVSMFEGVLSRDGSTFKLIRVEPYAFGGKKGFRFEYERTRKIDNVQMRGLGFGVIDRDELFAMLYHAPRLTFFPKQQMRVEAIAKSALIK